MATKITMIMIHIHQIKCNTVHHVNAKTLECMN